MRIENTEEFILFFGSDGNACHYFIETAKPIGPYKDELLNTLLQDNRKLKNTFKNSRDIKSVIEFFPHYKKIILNRILSSDELFEHIIHLNFQDFVNDFPDYSNQINQAFEKKLSRSSPLEIIEQFNKFNPEKKYFINLILHMPLRAMFLIETILGNLDLFERFIKDENDFDELKITIKKSSLAFKSRPSLLDAPTLIEAKNLIKPHEKTKASLDPTTIPGGAFTTLFTEPQNDVKIYTNEPKDQVNPTRLVANLPAFINAKNICAAKQKYLIVNIDTLKRMNKTQLIALDMIFSFLNKQGFEIYIYNKKILNYQKNMISDIENEPTKNINEKINNVIKRLNLSSSQFSEIEKMVNIIFKTHMEGNIHDTEKENSINTLNKKIQIQLSVIKNNIRKKNPTNDFVMRFVPEIRQLDCLVDLLVDLLFDKHQEELTIKKHFEKLKALPDEIEYLTEKTLTLLIKNFQNTSFQFNHDTSPNGLKTVRFKLLDTELPISNGIAEKELTKNGPQIIALIFLLSPYITKVDPQVVSKLTSLDLLNINGALHAESILSSFAPIMPQLRVLDLNDIPTDLTILQKINFDKLECLYIQNCGLSHETLVAILKQAPKLTNLQIKSNFKCFNENPITLKLLHLHDVTIQDCAVSGSTVEAILNSSHKLKFVILENCFRLNNTLIKINTKQIKNPFVRISNCNIKQKSIDEIGKFIAKFESKNNYDEILENSDRNVDPDNDLNLPLKNNEPRKKGKTLPPPKAEKSIDADTTPSADKKNIKRIFIGKPRSPDPRNIRLNSFNRIKSNDHASSDADVFILSNDEKELALKDLPNTKKSDAPLINEFKQKGDDHYFGRFEMDLTDEWQPMPSLFSTEKLESYYLNQHIDVEIKKSDKDGFNYIRLKNAEPGTSRNVMMEIILSCPASPKRLYNQLPAQIKDIINEYRGFREEKLEETDSTPTAQDYLNQINKQRAGACRHRTVAFKDKMTQTHPDVEVQMITNQIHMYPEIRYQGEWIPCDLGGYDSNVEIDDALLNDAMPDNTNQAEAEDESPDILYSLSLSSRGKPRASTYFKAIQNLTQLSLENNATFPTDVDLSHLDTLTISASKITVTELNDFLKRIPTLKTLKLSHCRIDPNDFLKIDLSSLPALQHVTMIGNFIPGIDALNQLMGSVKQKVKWVVQSPNITKETLEEKKSETQKDKKSTSEELHKNSKEEAHPTVEPVAENAAKLILKEPEHAAFIPDRYFATNLKQDAFSILNDESNQVLVMSAAPSNLRMTFEKMCQSIQKPCFYIDHPDELRCVRPFIERNMATNEGIIKKGPGGPLYDFLQQHPHGTLLINYNNFTASDIAKFNTLLDDDRIVDGTPIPKSYKVIGLINPDKPDIYQGADFYSRFDKQINYGDSINETTALPTLNPNDKSYQTAHKIELNGGYNWQGRLLGGWQIQGKQLIYAEGKLIEALKKGHKKIVFNNPPVNDAEFDRFIADLLIHQGIFHQGKLILPFSAEVQLSMAHEVSFPDKDQYLLAKPHTTLTNQDEILNSATLSNFIGRYEFDKKTNGLFLKPGLIEQYKNKTLSIHLTEPLNSYAWLTLLENLREHHTKLAISVAPNVTLPPELSINSIPLINLKSDTTTILIHSEQSWLLNYPKGALVIDISELESSDLLPALKNKFDETALNFEFSEKISFLLDKLEKNSTVALRGKWPPQLARALEPLIYKRLTASDVKGKLYLINDNKELFPGLIPRDCPFTLKTKPEPFLLDANFDDRQACVEKALMHSPFVLLSGATGVGKTNFVETIWKKQHPACHYGIDQLEAWIKDKTTGLKTLFIDEANITSHQWSEFEGLFNDPPSIFFKGEYYPLTPEHKIIFAGNPLAYGGERQRPAFFEHHQYQVNFNPIPTSIIAKNLGLDAATAKPILDIYEYITKLDPNDTLLTPREIIMMACLTQVAMAQHAGKIAPEEIARIFAYQLSQGYVPAHKKQAFDAIFKPTQELPPPELLLKNFVINDTNRPAIYALINHLQLRARRLANDPHVLSIGGLGGVIFEGDPGIGKSALTKEVLSALGLKENEDFYYIPASFSSKMKEALLLKAFHEGKIVIIDEINSSPMLERLLNALLEGHDLDGKPGKKGFMLIGTQNPPTFRGRVKTTLPLQHRLQTVVLNEYTKKEEKEILRHIGLPQRIRDKMLTEFEKQKENNPNLCFRDLFKAASKWVKHHEKATPLNIPLTPQPQVGSICKIVSIANIEQHYATQLGFEAMPLKANKQKELSIRRLAKANGSKQGEILEISMWQKNLTDMGYDSQLIDFKNNINLFVQTIEESLQAGNLPMLALAVDKEGQPDPTPTEAEEREHAAVITHYDPREDEVTIQHWGNSYTVDVVDLFQSSQALKNTRSQEHYVKNKNYNHENKSYEAKYIFNRKGNIPSIIPKTDTGFQSKLLIVKKPDLNHLAKARAELKRSLPLSSPSIFASEGKQEVHLPSEIVTNKFNK